MSFLIDFLRHTYSEGPSWYHVRKRASGGCNNLLYSGHMLLAMLMAMAWTVRYLDYLQFFFFPQFDSPKLENA